MKLRVIPFALSSGIVLGFLFLIATLWSGAAGGGEHLVLFSKFYPGYSVSPGGSILGLMYGFIYGFLGAAIFAGLYNALGKGSK